MLKHSGATEVRLRLAIDNGSVRIEVEDNGRGFRVNGALMASACNMRPLPKLAVEPPQVAIPRGTKVGFVVERVSSDRHPNVAWRRA